jgi:hypothetical protein
MASEVQQRTERTTSIDLLDEVTSPHDGDLDENSLLDSALGVDESDKGIDGDVRW